MHWLIDWLHQHIMKRTRELRNVTFYQVNGRRCTLYTVRCKVKCGQKVTWIRISLEWIRLVLMCHMHIHFTYAHLDLNNIIEFCNWNVHVNMYAHGKMNKRWNWEVNNVIPEKIRATWWNGIIDGACKLCTGYSFLLLFPFIAWQNNTIRVVDTHILSAIHGLVYRRWADQATDSKWILQRYPRNMVTILDALRYKSKFPDV